MIVSLKRYIPSRYKSKTKRFVKDIYESMIYSFIRKKPNSTHDSIIFVCKGNVCRSAFAEQYLKKNQSLNVNIASCGLDVDQGVSSPDKAIRVAAEFGVDLTSCVSKSISVMSMKNTHKIIVMEFEHYERIIQDYPNYKKHMFLLKDFLPWPKRLLCNIADPYGGEDSDFRRCFRTIKNALDRMIAQTPGSRSQG